MKDKRRRRRRGGSGWMDEGEDRWIDRVEGWRVL